VHVSVVDFVLVGGIVLVGSIVQGSIGLGLNMLSAPFVALIVPRALPATLVILALPIAATTLVREHHALDRVAIRWLLVGAIPGTAIGLIIVRSADARTLAIIVGATVLSGVIVSVASPPVPTTSRTALVAGFVSNLFGTATAVGGPPLALLFQHRTGPIARSTLGAFFLVSASLSIVGYVAAGTITGDQALFALELMPVMAVGLWSSRHFHVHVDGGWLRPAMLALSAVAGTAAIVRGIT